MSDEKDMMTIDWALSAKHYLDAVPSRSGYEREADRVEEAIKAEIGPFDDDHGPDHGEADPDYPPHAHAFASNTLNESRAIMAECDRQLTEAVCEGGPVQEMKFFPVQPVLTYEEVCNVLALQEKVDLLTAENIALKTDNKNLIEMNFNLEKQLQAKSEDLEDALESIESWEERCDCLENKVYDLEKKLCLIDEVLGG